MPQTVDSSDVFYSQPCPVCGRRLQIRVSLLGHRVYCQHCGGGFTAVDESLRGPPVADRVDDLLARATRALRQSGCEAADEQGVSW